MIDNGGIPRSLHLRAGLHLLVAQKEGNHVLELFWNYVGTVESGRNYFGTILELFWNYFGTILELFGSILLDSPVFWISRIWNYFGTPKNCSDWSELFWNYFGTILELFWNYLPWVELFWNYFGTLVTRWISLVTSCGTIGKSQKCLPPGRNYLENFSEIDICSRTIVNYWRNFCQLGHWSWHLKPHILLSPRSEGPGSRDHMIRIHPR